MAQPLWSGWAEERKTYHRVSDPNSGSLAQFLSDESLVTTLTEHSQYTGGQFQVGKCDRLPVPRHHLLLVEIVLVNVYPARFLVLARTGWDGSQRRTTEEGHLDKVGEDVEAQELALALNAVEGRVPSHCLAQFKNGAHEERVNADPEVAFPAWHSPSLGLVGGVAFAIWDLRFAPCEDDRLRIGLLGNTLTLNFSRPNGHFAGHGVHSNPRFARLNWSKKARSENSVEMRRLELLTPSLQRRCSPN